MSAIGEVKAAYPEAYAKQFNNSSRWYICDRPGGSVIATGESEADVLAQVWKSNTREATMEAAHGS